MKPTVLVLALVMCLVPSLTIAQDPPRTRLVILGTGTPNAVPERSGPATAVVVDDRAYIVDAGPGVVRRAAWAARDNNIPALQAASLNHVFITHLHSDHTVGLPDLLFTPWVLDRPDPLQVFGPPGIGKMMEGIAAAWADDIELRVNGLEPREDNRDGHHPLTTEVLPGLIYEDELVRVFAYRVNHGSWENPYAYRFEGPDRTIVISGDTAPAESVIEACDGCDVLVHEVYSAEMFQGRPAVWQRYHSAFHTSTTELAELASRARPGTLVLYHQLYWGASDDDLIAEIRAAGYLGRVVSARDLDVH